MTKKQQQSKAAPVKAEESKKVEVKDVPTESKAPVQDAPKQEVATGGEVKAPEPKDDPIPVKEPAQGPAPIVAAVTAETDLHPYCEDILKYAEVMAPNVPVERDTMLRQQMGLYQAVMGILNNFSGAEFHHAFGQALEIMHKHAPSFEDHMLFRGFQEMRLPTATRSRYEDILILMSSTANPETRGQALKAIDMAALFKNFDGEVEQKIRGFYR